MKKKTLSKYIKPEEIKIQLKNTLGNSHIRINGKELPCSKILISQEAGELLKVELTCFVDDFELFEKNLPVKVNIEGYHKINPYD